MPHQEPHQKFKSANGFSPGFKPREHFNKSAGKWRAQLNLHESILEKHLSLRKFFASGQTRSFDFRFLALERLESLISENKELICSALYSDLHKPQQESLISEIAVVLEEIRFAKKKLRSWMKPKSKKTPLILWPSKSQIHYEPLGVVLIIGPWNYPFQLLIAPLVGAIAAGNCAILKPSELTSRTSNLIAKLIQDYFPPDYIHTIEGGIPETTELLNQKFDHIFFTGSTPVGKIVMAAAAKNLVPVTLELGGKSPVIVCEDADLDLAARRIVWGKFYNAGQTCVAPDYLYAQNSIADVLIKKIASAIEQQFGAAPKESRSFGRIVNLKNCERLARMIDPKKVAFGGNVDYDHLYISPTVLQDVTWDDAVMAEEIFGPILPILSFDKAEDLFLSLGQRAKPLSAYLFSNSAAVQKQFISQFSFGGGCINDVVLHLSNLHLPFGGVGDSGMGYYHGEYSFQIFSHAKSIMRRSGLLDFSARYAPYNDNKLNFLRKIFRV